MVDAPLELSRRGFLGSTLGGTLALGFHLRAQKLLFWSVSRGALVMLTSCVVLWFPSTFPQLFRLGSLLAHDVVFVLFAIAIVFHVYLGAFLMSGAMQAMTRGSVRRSWARLHHPRWYREVTGDTSGPD